MAFAFYVHSFRKMPQILVIVYFYATSEILELHKLIFGFVSHSNTELSTFHQLAFAHRSCINTFLISFDSFDAVFLALNIHILIQVLYLEPRRRNECGFHFDILKFEAWLRNYFSWVLFCLFMNSILLKLPKILLQMKMNAVSG